jgi:hypothetical protein
MLRRKFVPLNAQTPRYIVIGLQTVFYAGAMAFALQQGATNTRVLLIIASTDIIVTPNGILRTLE